MAAGRPVITADTPAMRETFRDGESVCLVPTADPAALAARILELRDNPELCHEVASAAAALVHERYGSRNIAEQFVRHCAEVLYKPH